MRLPVRFAHALEHRHLIAGARRLAEVELRRSSAAWATRSSRFLQRLDPALHLRGLGGVGGEAVDEALLLGQHRLLAGVGGLAVGLADRPLLLVEVVVAGIDGDLAAVDLGDPGDDAVHELAVVRGHQQRAVERLEETFQPDDRLDVEVVGRLVHQQHVGAAKQHPGHRHPHLPAARQRADVAVDALVVEAEAVQDLARLGLERVAAEMVVFLLHLAEAGQDAVEVGGLGRVGHRVIEGLELVVQVADAAAAGNGLVEHRAPGHLLDVLAEVANRQPLRHRHVALVGGLLADNHPEQRGLAGAVGADQADLLTGIELEAGVDEEDLAAVLLANARERNHGSFEYSLASG